MAPARRWSASCSDSCLYVLLSSRWSFKQRCRYTERSRMAGPRFLSVGSTMNSLLSGSVRSSFLGVGGILCALFRLRRFCLTGVEQSPVKQEPAPAASPARAVSLARANELGINNKMTVTKIFHSHSALLSAPHSTHYSTTEPTPKIHRCLQPQSS